ncbi:ankyrin repeat protein [Gracilaria domingensis]|nr:ankyrin repeat protein [Gracilaria domingensis]
MSTDRISTPFAALIAAADSGDISWVKRSINAGAAIDCEDESRSGSTALAIASSHGHLQVVQYLLKNGADPEKRNNLGNTALIQAAKNGHSQVVRTLLNANAAAGHINDDGNTALTTAAWNGHSEVVGLLVAQVSPDSQLQHRTRSQNTALTIAALHMHLDVAKTLLAAGSNVDHMNENGVTALIAASQNGQVQLVSSLLESNANACVSDVNGNTPLHLALMNRHMDVARKLMEYGADLHVVNDAGRTPLDYVYEDHGTRKDLLRHDEKMRMAIMWHRRRKLSMNSMNILRWLRKEYITSLAAFVYAHKVLLWVVKRGVLGLQELRWLGGYRDYLLEQVYMPVSELHISDEMINFVVSPVLSVAEAAGFIYPGQGSMVKLAYEVRIHNRYVEKALQALRKGMLLLEERVSRLEHTQEEMQSDFKKVAENNKQMVDDMMTMNESLKDLHALLKKHQKLKMIGGLISLILTMIPVIGAPIGSIASATADVANFLDHGTEIGKELAVHILDVDLSAVKKTFDIKPLKQLEEQAWMRVKSVFAHSPFETFEKFLKELSNFDGDLAGLKPNESNETTGETQLMHSFRVIASKIERDTISAQDATSELNTLLKDTDPTIQVDEDDTLETVLNEVDENGRVNMTGFSSAFGVLQSKHLPRSAHHTLPELRSLFQNAAEPYRILKLAVAKHVLKRIFEPRHKWDEERVQRLLDSRATQEGFVDEESFTFVAQKICRQNAQQQD